MRSSPVPTTALLAPILLWALLSATSSARADEVVVGSEVYQKQLLSETLAQQGLHLASDSLAQGKQIEKIVVFSNEVIQDPDPWPKFANLFHATTREDVIRRELLFNVDDRWNQDLVDESERNLRNYLFLSVAKIVPCSGSSPDKIIVLVITKDLWSLRLNTNFTYISSTFQSLDVQLQELNLLGRMKELSVDYHQDLATRSLGENVYDPRVEGSRIALSQSSSLIVNSTSGNLEGGTGTLAFGLPLYSLSSEWGWNVSSSFDKEISRLFSNLQLVQVAFPDTGDTLPYEFNKLVVDVSATVTRSYGTALKQNVYGGWRAWDHDYSIPAPPVPVQAQTLNEFSNDILPHNETAGMLIVGYKLYRADYRKLTEIETFSVTEDYQLGPTVALEERWANPAFGFSSNFLESVANFGWTWLSDSGDVLNVSAGAQGRYEQGQLSGTDWVDEYLNLSIHNVSPRFGPFKLAAGARINRRTNDLDHLLSTLGGDTSLRGYPSEFFEGSQLWGANLELRSVPLTMATVSVGGAFFMDLGDAENSPAQWALNPSVGAGIRVVFPQFNKDVLRLDFGIPLEALPGGISPSYITAQFGQAF